MRTIQITIDEHLLQQLDKTTSKLKTTRSAFIRSAIMNSFSQLKTLYLEKKHRAGYQNKPIEEDEFSHWEKEQIWED